MPTYTIQAPDGRKIKVEAGSEDEAISGVQSWVASNPKPSTKGGLAGSIENRARQDLKPAAEAEARRDARAGNFPIFDPINDALAPARQAAAAWKADHAANMDRVKNFKPPSSVGDVVAGLLDFSTPLRQGQAALATLGAPFAALSNQVVNPAARAAEKAGLGDEQSNAEMFNNSLMGLRPGPGGLKAAPRVAPVKPPSQIATTVAAFDRAGVQPSLATAAGGKGASALTNVVAENPIAGVPARGRLRAQATQAGDKARALAGEYGTVSSPQIAGENIQAGVNRFANDRKVTGNPSAPASATSFSSKADALYGDVFSQIDAAQKAKTAPRADLSSLGGGQGSRPYTSIIAPQTEATLGILANRAGGEIGAIISDPKLSSIAQAVVADRGVMSFGDLRALRTWVRTAQRDPALRQGVDDAALQSLERALTADIQGNAEALAGPQVAAKLRRADQYYAAGSERIKKALQPFDNAASGESAYQRIIQAAGSTGSADVQRLASLKRSLHPDEWGDIAANVLNGLGKPTAGAAGADEGFSVSTFLTNYNKLSPKAREVLFGSTGGGGAEATRLKDELDNLAFVVDRLKGVEKGANTSKTAVGGQAIATLGAGSMLSWPVTLKVLGGMAGAGELLTNPAFVRWLAEPHPVNASMHFGELDKLAKASPAIAGYRQHLAEEIAAQHNQGDQPVPQDVPAPEIPEHAPAY